MRRKVMHKVIRSVSSLVAVSLVVVGGLVAAISNPAIAQQVTSDVGKTALTALPGAKEAISPDGLHKAYVRSEHPTSLYLSNVSSGEEVLIAKGPGGMAEWETVSGISFSPDGSEVVFSADPGRPFEGKIYMVRTDGSSSSKDALQLPVLASDSKRTSEKSKATTKRLYDTAIYGPSFSPDGSEVLVEVLRTSGNRDAEGRIDHSGDKVYVGLLSASGRWQAPQATTEGHPLFWSHDGGGIFYITQGAIDRYDIATKQTKTVADASKINILGRVPGADAVFVSTRNQPDAALTVLTLDGTVVSEALKSFAAGLPRQDAQGRLLTAIDAAGPHSLTLRYRPSFGFLKGGVNLDVAKQMKDSGALSNGTQQVAFP
jgi:hypothetical protein